MGLPLTAESFEKLLRYFDQDRERAGEKYEDLRITLIRYFEWRRAPFPEEQADRTLDRVSSKLGEGVEIANLRAYCYEIARLIHLELQKSPLQRLVPLESAGFSVPAATPEATAAQEERQTCLDACLAALPEDHRELILEYYGGDGRQRIERRRALSERLRVPRETLANRAQRVRNRLEQCVILCRQKKSAI